MKNNSLALKIGTLIFTGLMAFQVSGFAQEDSTAVVEETPKARPARPAFESGLLFDATTTTLQPSKTLEMVIQHRFGTVDKGITDLYGVWAPSNIRLALNYSPLDNVSLGLGTTKFNKMQDLQIKYRPVQQTRDNSMPVTVVLHEVVGLDASDEAKYGINYKFGNRFSYFTEVIVSRRFNDMFSLQLAPSFTHYNMVDSTYDHDRIAMSFAGRLKFSPQTSLMVAADFPLFLQGISEHNSAFNEANNNSNIAKPNLSIGFEISTSTHAFHIYLQSAQNILPQENMMWNQNDFFSKGILLGLNITRLWNF